VLSQQLLSKSWPNSIQEHKMTTSWRIWGLAVLCVAATLAGCSGDGSSLGPDGRPLAADNDANGDENGDANGEENGDGGAAKVTLAVLSMEIFTPNCTFSGCHGGGSFLSANMSLEADRIADEIIGVASSGSNLNRIEPGNPEASYLLKKVRGDSDASSQMPLNRTPLSAAQIEMIRAWIEAGAPIE
jgi:hypothetical protein